MSWPSVEQHEKNSSYLCVRFPILDDSQGVSTDHQPGHLTVLAHLPPGIVLDHAGQWEHWGSKWFSPHSQHVSEVFITQVLVGDNNQKKTILD